jgi:NAD(P)-dependent dehydrogenase (short-subunit alcohol dehydrogenase family)
MFAFMIQLKPLSQQVIVLTGATSGIGLATAREAGKAGAKLILVARNAEALDTLAAELRAAGGEAHPVPGDIAEPETAERAAAAAIAQFGRLDTWVNDAGAFIYGSLEDTPLEDQRRLIDVTYWGTVHGSLAAMRHMKESGGAVVNVGSVLGERAIALQGPYCAAKFAVKAFTDTLRMEIAMSGYPISVTLIKPGPIDTPYMEHARNLIGSPGTRNPPPAYHPRVVARAILHACAHPVRDLTVGGGGLGFAVMGKLFPALTDAAMVALARPTQTSDDPGRLQRRDNLYQPKEDLAETSSLGGLPARRTSLVLEAQIHPLATAAAALGVGAAVMLMGRMMGRTLPPMARRR